MSLKKIKSECVAAVYEDRVRIAKWLRAHANTWNDPAAMELEKLADQVEDGSYPENKPPPPPAERKVSFVEVLALLKGLDRK